MKNTTANHSRLKLLSGILTSIFATVLIVFAIAFQGARADNPTFFFSTSYGCGSAVTTLDTDLGPLILYLCIDGDNEGAGLLGAETHISYSPADVTVASSGCSAFDTCVDLSESGTIRLLAASGALPEGNAVTSQVRLATLSLNFLNEGDIPLSFSAAQVIDENEVVKNRTGLGINITVVKEEPVEEEPAPEEEVPPDESEEGPVEEAPPETEEEVMPAEEEPAPEEVPPVEPEEGPVEEAPPVPMGSLVGLSADPLSVTAVPGGQVQVISTAHYSNGRPSENTTSCFPCPTAGNPDVDGTVTYTVTSGLGWFIGSKLHVNPSASPGSTIVFHASFTDNVSGTSATSADRVVTVISSEAPLEEEPAAEEEAEPAEEVPAEEAPVEEEPAPEEEAEPVPEEEAEPAEEVPAEEEAESETHPAAASPEEEVFLREAQNTVIGEDLQRESDIQVTLPAPGEDTTLIDSCITQFSSSEDQDQDGLSDRTECYVRTDPTNPDTDGDTCFDGEELNRFYTSPLTGTDCSISEFLDANVVITDPQPNWILKWIEVSGLTPKRSISVGITAFPALHRTLQPTLDDFEALLDTLSQEIDIEEEAVMQAHLSDVAESVSTLLESLDKLNSYLTEDIDASDHLKKAAKDLTELLNKGPETVSEEAEQAQTLYNAMDSHRTMAIFLGKVSDFQEVGTGNALTAGFHLIPTIEIADGTYDLVATATFADGGTKSSAPVRMILDSTIEVATPSPNALDNVPINDLTLRIHNKRPVLSGRTVYGARVFATWESVILASSIIADSSEGYFDIQAPQELGVDLDHTVTVYAVIDTEKGKVRSENAQVSFEVLEKEPSMLLYWILGIVAVLFLAGFWARRKLKIRLKTADHRAREKELYEAFAAAESETEVTPVETVPVEKSMQSTEESVQNEIKEPTDEIPPQNS